MRVLLLTFCILMLHTTLYAFMKRYNKDLTKRGAFGKVYNNIYPISPISTIIDIFVILDNISIHNPII